MLIPDTVVERLYEEADAARWRVSRNRFRQALESSAAHAARSGALGVRDLERYLDSLHLQDLALACGCADGDDAAWEHLVREHRPVLYRAADALDPTGSSRDLADSLYADLFGLRVQENTRQSLLEHFHGRSTLSTWLRAVLAQRYVDRVRAARRLTSLPAEDSPSAPAAPVASDPDRARCLEFVSEALTQAVAALGPRDRLRVACYYAQELTLAETGRLLGEHEATVSRQLAKSRRRIGDHVKEYLRTTRHLSDTHIAQCLADAAADAGPLDVRRLFRHDSDEEIG